MNLAARYLDKDELRVGLVIRDAVLGIAALITIIVCWPFYSVPTGFRGVVTQFGAIKSTESEGLAILPPWQKLTNFSIRADQTNIKDAEGATSDTQPVHVGLTVRYNVEPNKVAEVFEKYTHTGNLDSFVATATMETFKAVTARYTAPDLIAKRSQVSSDVLALLRQKMSTYGANIISVDMTQFAFGKEYMKAITEKVTQEQQKLAADNKFLTVQAEQKQKVAVAEAEATALKAKADGEAYSVLAAAKAQAESLRVQNAALRENKDVLELRRIEVQMAQAQKWDGALPYAIYANAPIPFMPAPMPPGNPMARPQPQHAPPAK